MKERRIEIENLIPTSSDEHTIELGLDVLLLEKDEDDIAGGFAVADTKFQIRVGIGQVYEGTADPETRILRLKGVIVPSDNTTAPLEITAIYGDETIIREIQLDIPEQIGKLAEIKLEAARKASHGAEKMRKIKAELKEIEQLANTHKFDEKRKAQYTEWLSRLEAKFKEIGQLTPTLDEKEIALAAERLRRLELELLKVQRLNYINKLDDKVREKIFDRLSAYSNIPLAKKIALQCAERIAPETIICFKAYKKASWAEEVVLKAVPKAVETLVGLIGRYKTEDWACEAMLIAAEKRPCLTLQHIESFYDQPWTSKIVQQAAKANPAAAFEEIERYEYQPWAEEIAVKAAKKASQKAIDLHKLYEEQPWAKKVLTIALAWNQAKTNPKAAVRKYGNIKVGEEQDWERELVEKHDRSFKLAAMAFLKKILSNFDTKKVDNDRQVVETAIAKAFPQGEGSIISDILKKARETLEGWREKDQLNEIDKFLRTQHPKLKDGKIGTNLKILSDYSENPKSHELAMEIAHRFSRQAAANYEAYDTAHWRSEVVFLIAQMQPGIIVEYYRFFVEENWEKELREKLESTCSTRELAKKIIAIADKNHIPEEVEMVAIRLNYKFTGIITEMADTYGGRAWYRSTIISIVPRQRSYFKEYLEAFDGLEIQVDIVRILIETASPGENLDSELRKLASGPIDPQEIEELMLLATNKSPRSALKVAAENKGTQWSRSLVQRAAAIIPIIALDHSNTFRYQDWYPELLQNIAIQAKEDFQVWMMENPLVAFAQARAYSDHPWAESFLRDLTKKYPDKAGEAYSTVLAEFPFSTALLEIILKNGSTKTRINLNHDMFEKRGGDIAALTLDMAESIIDELSGKEVEELGNKDQQLLKRAYNVIFRGGTNVDNYTRLLRLEEIAIKERWAKELFYKLVISALNQFPLGILHCWQANSGIIGEDKREIKDHQLREAAEKVAERYSPDIVFLGLESYINRPWIKDVLLITARRDPGLLVKNITSYWLQPWAEEVAEAADRHLIGEKRLEKLQWEISSIYIRAKREGELSIVDFEYKGIWNHALAGVAAARIVKEYPESVIPGLYPLSDSVEWTGILTEVAEKEIADRLQEKRAQWKDKSVVLEKGKNSGDEVFKNFAEFETLPWAKDALLVAAANSPAQAFRSYPLYKKKSWAKDILLLATRTSWAEALKNFERYSDAPWAEDLVAIAVPKAGEDLLKYILAIVVARPTLKAPILPGSRREGEITNSVPWIEKLLALSLENINWMTDEKLMDLRLEELDLLIEIIVDIEMAKIEENRSLALEMLNEARKTKRSLIHRAAKFFRLK